MYLYDIGIIFEIIGFLMFLNYFQHFIVTLIDFVKLYLTLKANLKDIILNVKFSLKLFGSGYKSTIDEKPSFPYHRFRIVAIIFIILGLILQLSFFNP